MANALADSFLNAAVGTLEPVEVPGVGICYVKVRSGLERQILMRDWIAWREARGGHAEAGPFFHAFVIARELLDAKGERLFNDGQVEQIAASPTRLVDLVIFAIDKHNALTDAEAERILKNSKAILNSNSGSGSQTTGDAA